VRLVYGDRNHVVGEPAPAARRALLPGATLRVVPGAGHLLPLTHWEDVLGGG
jgi:pimeloyl-ACP methyl ester carboxylesterase